MVETSHGIELSRDLIVVSAGDPHERMTWGEFSAENADDMPMLREVAAGLLARGSARVGGGAAPLFRVSLAVEPAGGAL